MNPRNGAVYALASYPRFDQARAATDPEYLRSLLNPNDPRHLLVNRATQGVYPTGSTFKPIVAEAGARVRADHPLLDRSSARAPTPSAITSSTTSSRESTPA